MSRAPLDALRDYDEHPTRRVGLVKAALRNDPQAMRRYRQYLDGYRSQVAQLANPALRGMTDWARSVSADK
jgi:hypothetical protein